jgi:hypothetical protein
MIVDETESWRSGSGFALEFGGNAGASGRCRSSDAGEPRRLDWNSTVDFLVAGLGFGALLVLVGYAVREFGVFLFAPGRIRKQFPEKEELSKAWREICRFGSIVAMIAGVAIWLLLAVAVALAVSDKTGALLLAIAATVASVVGVGAIFLAYRRLFSAAALSKRIDVTAVSSGWAEPEVVADNDTEPVGGWRPRVIPKPTETFVEDMPTWGAFYEEPIAAAPEAEESVADVEPISENHPESSDSSEPIETAAPAEPEPVVAGVEAPPELEPEASSSEAAAPTEDPEIGEPEAEAAVQAPESKSEPNEPEAVQPEQAVPAPVDQVIAEAPAPAQNDAKAAAPRRFKSALLSDIDEPAAVDANAKYKSTILADLSAVRLPDDGPRFRSTALVDVAKPETDEPELDSENSAPPRHD